MAVTRADVAKLAGVSPSVVSYVTTPGSRPVAPATRKRVVEAIEELGYRPNLIAQALRAGPTQSVGLLIPDYLNPFFSELAQEISELLFGEGIVMLIGSPGDNEDREQRYLESFVDRRVDGLISVVPVNDGRLESVATNTPVVLVDRAAQETLPSVSTDHRESARLGTQYLAGLGHKTVGMIAGPAHLAVSKARIQGWREAAEADGLPAGDELVSHASFTRAGGYDAARTLLRGDACTALLVSSDTQAIGALKYADEVGLSVPKDLSIVTIDGTELAHYAVPELTRVAQPIKELAKVAVEILLSQMRSGKDKGAPTSGDASSIGGAVLLQPVLEHGDTTAPPAPVG